MLSSMGLRLAWLARRNRKECPSRSCGNPFHKRTAPELPPNANGTTKHIWPFLLHMNQRIDALYTLIFAGAGIAIAVMGVAAAGAAILVTVLVK